MASPQTTNANNASARGTTRRALIIVGVLALLGLAYSLARVDILRARLVEVEIAQQAMQENNTALRNQVEALIATNAAQGRQVSELQTGLSGLTDNLGSLSSRAAAAQRQSITNEALYLLRLADDQLQVAHNVTAAIDSLTAAETVLQSGSDATLEAMQRQVGNTLAQLRSLPRGDLKDIQQQLTLAERQVDDLKLAGLLQPSSAANETLPDAGFKRAWVLLKRSMSRLFSIRKVGGDAGAILTSDEQILRRRHLQLLLLNARLAVSLHDQNGYVNNLRAADIWLKQTFDSDDAAVGKLSQQLQQLEQQNIAPNAPDLSSAIQALTRASAALSTGTP
ncbi:MAG: uroporphyrinogen-III C-methyltransferase [Steroidobacteraceae bacterium]